MRLVDLPVAQFLRSDDRLHGVCGRHVQAEKDRHAARTSGTWSQDGRGGRTLLFALGRLQRDLPHAARGPSRRSRTAARSWATPAISPARCQRTVAVTQGRVRLRAPERAQRDLPHAARRRLLRSRAAARPWATSVNPCTLPGDCCGGRVRLRSLGRLQRDPPHAD